MLKAFHSLLFIHLSGDTDTNGAIAGALLGAFYGKDNMESDVTTRENMETLLACTPTSENSDIPREQKYHASELVSFVTQYLASPDRILRM